MLSNCHPNAVCHLPGTVVVKSLLVTHVSAEGPAVVVTTSLILLVLIKLFFLGIFFLVGWLLSAIQAEVSG
jgi:hypothetical protein